MLSVPNLGTIKLPVCTAHDWRGEAVQQGLAWVKAPQVACCHARPSKSPSLWYKPFRHCPLRPWRMTASCWALCWMSASGTRWGSSSWPRWRGYAPLPQQLRTYHRRTIRCRLPTYIALYTCCHVMNPQQPFPTCSAQAGYRQRAAAAMMGESGGPGHLELAGITED